MGLDIYLQVCGPAAWGRRGLAPPSAGPFSSETADWNGAGGARVFTGDSFTAPAPSVAAGASDRSGPQLRPAGPGRICPALPPYSGRSRYEKICITTTPDNIFKFQISYITVTKA